MGADAQVGDYNPDGDRVEDGVTTWNPRHDNFNTYEDGVQVEQRSRIVWER